MKARMLMEAGGAAGHMAGGFIVIRVILILIIIAMIVRLVRGIMMRRSMGRMIGGKAGRKNLMMMRMMPELSKEQAAGIIVNDMRKKNASEEEIRTRLIEEYSIEPVIADALLLVQA